MSLLSVDDLNLAFGAKTIFEGEGLAVERRDRLGIVGANGTGKTTLMGILVGKTMPDSGRISRARGCRVGYLPQEHSDPGDGPLLDVVLAAAPGREGLEERIVEIETALAETDDTSGQLELSQNLADLHAELSDIEQRFGTHLAQAILSGLGFAEEDFDRSVGTFSGGWRMRAALAALLFQRPDVMLLDEPTNHLDMPSVNWLNGFLSGLKQALVLTCHDREFLNRHVNRVISLEPGGLRFFRGNYDQYLEQRELDQEYLKNRIRREEQRRRDLEGFVTRFKAKASKARQAQSKVKQIEKLIEQQVELPAIRRSVAIRFDPVVRAGGTVIDIQDLTFSWGERAAQRGERQGRPLFSKLNLEVHRGDRIAIVGTNGAGKTTLLKLIAGEVEPNKGQIELGLRVTPSYFAQHHTEVLNVNNTVIDEVWQAAPSLSQTAARTLCGSFLFSGDEIEKPVGVLSGGEKTRVALARLLAAPGNLLLLDEPTNHLDTESADQLTASLEGYDGTLIFVSHNIDFARRLSNKVWDVRKGAVSTYPGSLADYLDHLTLVQQSLFEQAPKPAETSLNSDRQAKKDARLKARQEETKLRTKRTKLSKQIAALEAELATLEEEQTTLEKTLADPATHQDPENSRQLALRYDQVKEQIEAKMAVWEEAEQDLEALG